MTLKANHLTIARMVLLPLPVWLLYHGTWARMWALAAFAILGLTDYLDGLLARRQGATPLGKLLDPIADKIFVASMVLPLVDLEILPLWMGWLLMMREFLVTELRRELSTTGEGLPVVELAKVKTTLQMSGLGLMVMTATFPGKEVTMAFLSGALVSTAVLAITIFVRFGEFSFRMRSALLFMTAGLVTALLLPPRQVNLVYGLVIVAITLFTGAGYAVRGLPTVAARGGRAVMELVCTLLTPLAPLLFFHAISPWGRILLLLLICEEFASQGLETWVTQKGGTRSSSARHLVKGGVALVAFATAWFAPDLIKPDEAVAVTALVAFSISLYDMAGFLRG